MKEYEGSTLYKRFQELRNEINPDHTVVFNTDIIKTKQQLADIWQKANK